MKQKIILTSGLPSMMPIIKIVGDWCNLRCDYCLYYTNNQEKKTVMDKELLEKFIKEYLDNFEGHLKFTWHGGEPLLAGIPFFKRIIALQKKYRKKNQFILNTIQTNGTLITQQWADFFKTHKFRIGISLDGIKQAHNKFRKDKHGKGTFNKTLQGLKILQKNKVPAGILHVLTRSNLNTVKQNLDFFVNELGIKNIATSVYLPSNNPGMKNEEITNEELTQFYKTLIKFWIDQDNKLLQIRDIDNFIAGIIGKQASLCSFGGTCSSFFLWNTMVKYILVINFRENRIFYGEIFPGSLWQKF